MSESRINEIQDILTEVDLLLRERLRPLGLEIGHVLLAIAPDGTGVVRSNVGPGGLGDMAELLAVIADGTVLQRPEDDPLH